MRWKFIGLLMLILLFLLQTVHIGSQNSTSSEELIQNGGFEKGGSPAPEGWFRDLAQNGNKGSVSQDRTRFHSGQTSIKMQPNSQNVGDQRLSIAQIIPAGPYRGKKVEFSGYMAIEGGAGATLAMLNIVQGRPSGFVATQHASSSEWAQQRAIYDVPDDPSVQLVLACIADGQSGNAWFDDVSVVLYGEPRADTPSPSPQTALEASVRVDASNVIRQIPGTLYGTNVEWRWNGNFLWQEHSRRPDPELVRLARELGVSLIRFPGGIYSDFYHWRDGIGPYEKRPEVLHQPGKKERSRPNFGTDEALDFAQKVGGELLITVNAGTGTAQEAADWVRYVNGNTGRVRFWEVGNELYIHDDSPTTKSVAMDPAAYAARFREFARAMRAVDPRIKIGAIGGENQGRYAFVHYPDWNRIVLEKAGDQIDFLAVHNAYAPPLSAGDDRQDLRTVYRAMLAAPVLIARNLKVIAQQIADYVPARASEIPIAVTEWGPLFQMDFQGRYVDHPKTLGSALFAASALKVLIESPQTEIANFWFLNDVSVLGWIGSRNGDFPANPDWAPTARYYAFQLYTRHFGKQLVQSEVAGPAYNSKAVGFLDAVKDVPYLDIISSLSADGRWLYIMAINKHFDSAIETSIDLRNFQPDPTATAWTLTGTDIDANTGTIVIKVPGLRLGKQAEDQQNSRFYKGGPGEITLSSSTATGIGTQFTYRFPAHSVTSLMLTRAADLR